MRVPQRLDIALRAMVELARLDESERMAASELSARLDLPRRFLEQQITELANKGLLECRRGRGGGCRLARSASKMTVADVAAVVEGGILDNPVGEKGVVPLMWRDVALALQGLLAEITLSDLARRQDLLESAEGSMYFI